MCFCFCVLQCSGIKSALMRYCSDMLSSELENVVRAVWRPDPVQQAGVGDCEARGITEYFWTELARIFCPLH